jgi:2-desacetyl-2-hydroxyethyl bacteriochlorophyllide A dehydrogenase
MKAALFYGGRDIRVETLPDPQPGPGEVLVRVRAAGICGSDLHGYRRPAPEGAPRGGAPRGRENGHELAGVVAALGPGVTGLSPGQRVGIEPEHLIGCGACQECRRGDSHLCATRGQRDGARLGSHGFSEYDVCLAQNVHPLPDSVSEDAASILDCYACAVHALHRTPVTPDSTALVIGTGAIGMTLGQVLRAAGARQVIMAGTRRAPLEIARAAGAADLGIALSEGDPQGALMDLTAGRGADVVYETVGGDAPTLVQAVSGAARGGSVCIMGIFGAPQPLDTAVAYRKELTITWSNSYSTWHGRSEYQIALDLLAAGRVRAEPLLTHHFPLERIAEAFAAADDKQASGAVKVLVHA